MPLRRRWLSRRLLESWIRLPESFWSNLFDAPLAVQPLQVGRLRPSLKSPFDHSSLYILVLSLPLHSKTNEGVFSLHSDDVQLPCMITGSVNI